MKVCSLLPEIGIRFSADLLTVADVCVSFIVASNVVLISIALHVTGTSSEAEVVFLIQL